ncbi:MAG: class I SAM-dependent methyltransferase [Candidatus Heimdallarchaeota archaeon]|nr:class I SAM-dependent methyltransferase [Candidatus Heimdallarchaeota archaeon]
MAQNSTTRFSNRVENYIKYRPSYPDELIIILQEKGVLSYSSKIADIGSGTGIFTKLLLETGCQVLGVEPNTEMRQAAEFLLRNYPNFTSIDGRAEVTSIADNSIDVITVAQAFHWFDLPATKKEFLRILKPEGSLVLIWNERLIDDIPFQMDYDFLLQKYCPEYKQPSYLKFSFEEIRKFFGNSKTHHFSTDNHQVFDFPSFQGRFESSSYALTPDHPDYPKLLSALRALYEKYKVDDLIKIKYKTQMYYGQMSST